MRKIENWCLKRFGSDAFCFVEEAKLVSINDSNRYWLIDSIDMKDRIVKFTDNHNKNTKPGKIYLGAPSKEYVDFVNLKANSYWKFHVLIHNWENPGGVAWKKSKDERFDVMKELEAIQ